MVPGNAVVVMLGGCSLISVACQVTLLAAAYLQACLFALP